MGGKTLTGFNFRKVRWLISFAIIASVLTSIAGFLVASQKTNVQQIESKERPTVALSFSLNFKSLGGTLIKENFAFDHNSFIHSENKYNHDLAKASFALSISAFSAGDTIRHWGEIGNFGREKNLKLSFDELKLTDQTFVGYDKSLNANDSTAAFGLAKKTLVINGENVDLVVVAIRGGGYGAEWADNFNLGSKGKYHNGFEKSANNIKLHVDKYITNKCGDDKIKLWITGFSRGGAIANILASKFNSKNSENISVFSYTFGSPNTVISDEKSEYKNIFNIINPYDTITSLPPSEWGFSREGTDVIFPLKSNEQTISDMYDKVSSVLKQMTGENYNLTSDKNMKPIREIMLALAQTREEFSKNYEPVFKDLMLYSMTKVKKDKWEKIGFKDFLFKKYSSKAKNAYEKIKGNNHIISANEMGLNLPEEFIDFLVLAEIHNLNSDHKISISSIRVETIKNLFYSFSQDMFDNGARLHSPEAYLAWLKVYNYEDE